jgi:hypothetical protein
VRVKKNSRNFWGERLFIKSQIFTEYLLCCMHHAGNWGRETGHTHTHAHTVVDKEWSLLSQSLSLQGSTDCKYQITTECHGVWGWQVPGVLRKCSNDHDWIVPVRSWNELEERKEGQISGRGTYNLTPGDQRLQKIYHCWLYVEREESKSKAEVGVRRTAAGRDK